MLDKFPVTSKFSSTQTWILRSTIVLSAVAIAVYNFMTSCSPYYDIKYSPNNCVKTMIPPGSQIFYNSFSMATKGQLSYDEFTPQNCSTYNVAIKAWFAARDAPQLKIYMDIGCNNDIDLSVVDFNFKFWHDHYNEIINTVIYYRKWNTSSSPIEAVESKHNWGEGKDNSLRLFDQEKTVAIFGDTDKTVDRSLFEKIMRAAVDDVQTGPIPGVKYLCNRCGSHALWSEEGAAPALVWKLIFNTVNTTFSVYALILFLLCLSTTDSLYDILSKIQRQDKDEMVPFMEIESEQVRK
ncbi:hypothetical protein BGX28_009606 [Mortierella sp. GBA30]|nr:hypothetical protein BGX28_009606 [Mortierella sp. GBA30]